MEEPSSENPQRGYVAVLLVNQAEDVMLRACSRDGVRSGRGEATTRSFVACIAQVRLTQLPGRYRAKGRFGFKSVPRADFPKATLLPAVERQGLGAKCAGGAPLDSDGATDVGAQLAGHRQDDQLAPVADDGPASDPPYTPNSRLLTASMYSTRAPWLGRSK